MTIGERVKSLRKEQGLSQEDLAKQLFISRQAVSLWEKGESFPSIDNMLMLKKLYGISIDEWLGDGEVVCNSQNNCSPACENSKSNLSTALPKKRAKLIRCIICLLVTLIIAIVGVCNLTTRYKILYPLGKTNYNITKLSPIIVESLPATTSHKLVFENAKIQIEAILPERFVEQEDMDWLFYDANDNFVGFSILSGEELNLLASSKTPASNKADGYLNQLGLDDYLSRSLYVLSADISNVNLFSSAKEVHIAGAVRSLRSVMGVENNGYSEIFVKNAMGITVGYALQMDYNRWSIFWQLGENLVCNIIIRDADIAQNPNTLATFLSTFQFSIKYTDN